MSSMAVRASNRLADMVDWLESGPSIALRDGDRFVRVEDFERDGSYVVRAELPGVDPDQDIEVSLEGDYLTIRGERHEEIREKNRSEFRYGSFSRSLRMPPGADASAVQATYRDGILEVVVPLGEERPQTQIPVVRTDR
ncbi:Hsp20/alpha crystallin family protein [Nocardioides sp.]|uniref:Hsp20/alpha crystallin family protein n=1 Tax=Nocardioides sp. TaxID=35761 RepID=UPI002ED8E22E